LWGSGEELDAREVAAAGEFAGAVEGADAGPVVEGLEGEVEVVVGLEFEDGEAALASDGEEVEEGAAGCGRCEGLGVDGGGAEVGGEEGEVAAEDGLEPALGLEAVEGVGGGAAGMAAVEELGGEVAEEVLGGFVEEGFVGGGAEEDLVAMGEGAGDQAVTDAGVVEAVEGEGDFGGGAGADFGGGEEAGGEQGFEVGDGCGGAFESGLGIEGVGELDGLVAVVGDGGGGEVVGGGVELEEFPLGEGGVEPGHAGAGGGGGAGGDDEAESVEDATPVAVGAAVVEPEDAEGEGAVDGGGGFVGADAEDGPGGMAMGEDPAGVGGSEAVFEVHGGAEGVGDEGGEGGGEGLLEGAEVAAAGGIAGGGGAEFGVGDEGKGLRLAMAEAEGFEAEGIAAGLDGGDGADEIFFVGPEVEEAAAVVGGDGALGEAEVEEEAAVFEDGGAGVIGEEGFDGLGEGGGGGGCGGGWDRGGGWSGWDGGGGRRRGGGRAGRSG